ncbi:HAD-IC family P-type ATPase [Rhodonellum sp.]|uniref:cation-translocating P-type ATPase n=1 Tax=Rhodonellum sp. TaxID=2231180 RepID=UPI00271FD765|nr:HAD-IC family P-type ATPase [Rhodonellum sp.]MDO9554833.1 HAD-IC family P-type ATPase [Rhodonellum sp.]
MKPFQTKPHTLDIQDLLEELNTSDQGLSPADVQEKQKVFGKNEIPDQAGRPLWKIILKQFTNLMVYILLLAAAISYFTEHYLDVYVILGIILINAVIGFVQEYKAEGAVAALRSLLVPKCKVVREGELQTIDSKELVPGDLIALEEGDIIPADARVWLFKNARTTEASLTGEALPVQKTNKKLPENISLGEKTNMVWKSTYLASGSVRAIVTGTGLRTQIGDIASSLKTITPKKTNFQIKTDQLAKQMAYIAISSAILLFLAGYFFLEVEVSEVLLISIAALVSAIPEGLPAVLSIVLAVGSYRMSHKNAIIREISATESLGSVSTIITDKTGTLTQNTMTIKKIWIPGVEEAEVTGEGWESKGDLLAKNEDIKSFYKLFEIAAHCHQTAVSKKESGQYQVTGDPTEAAFLVLANKVGQKKQLPIKEDIAFDAELKYRSTIVEKNGTETRFIIGAPEAILAKCNSYHDSWGSLQKLNDITIKPIQDKFEKWSKESFRVLAMAQQSEHLNQDHHNNFEFVGLAGMLDPPRPGVLEAVNSCHQAGIRVIMATGDHSETALAIGKKVGIVLPGREKVYTDTELQQMDEEQLDKAVMEADVFSRLSPIMKLKIAQSLQKQGELIAMTGDGVNDAPALKQANVGVSMGIMGTDVARDASVMVLADDNFSTIVHAIEQGRIVFNNARRTSFYLVTTSLAEIFTLISAVSLGLSMPLTATQILWINLVTDGLCDKALATEKGQGNELTSPPINPKENILSKRIFPLLVINILLMTGLAITAFKWYLPEGIEKARTIVFIVMSFSQLFNVFNMRNLRGSTFKIGLFSNKWVNLAFLLSVLIQILIIQTPVLSQLFDFRPVRAVEFILWASLGSMTFWVVETYKLIQIKK